MKVLKEGIVPKGTVTCYNCHSVLEYGNGDLHQDRYNTTYLSYVVICPVCNCETKAEWVHNDKQGSK